MKTKASAKIAAILKHSGAAIADAFLRDGTKL